MDSAAARFHRCEFPVDECPFLPEFSTVFVDMIATIGES
jgi:hypothetical protein